MDSAGYHDTWLMLDNCQPTANHQTIQRKRFKVPIHQNAGTNQQRKPLPLGKAIPIWRQYQDYPQTGRKV